VIVSAVEDGTSAVVDARRLRPEVVVVDFAMPGLNGIQAARQIPKGGIASKIAFISANEEPEGLSEIFQAETCGHVFKSRLNSDLVFGSPSKRPLPDVRLFRDELQSLAVSR
jgi:DNA-binding NarL/FixJ family response regulator